MSACLGIWARRRRQRYFVVVASAIVVAAAFAVPGTFWLLLLARRPLRVRSVLFYATN